MQQADTKATEKIFITVAVSIDAPVEKIWNYFTAPEHIIQWCQASDDWHAPRATNDIRTGGKFTTRMEAKDGSMGFDFEGIYTNVRQHETIEYAMEDGRNVKVDFVKDGDAYKVIESFEAETINSPELQKSGWQAILNNFKKYVESN
jgi:uncharacterized protein YndB with AHSA1/START domain